MKKLTRNEMKQLVGGIRPPINGVCYQVGENCTQTSQCCPNSGLVCVGPGGKTCQFLIEID